MSWFFPPYFIQGEKGDPGERVQCTKFFFLFLFALVFFCFSVSSCYGVALCFSSQGERGRDGADGRKGEPVSHSLMEAENEKPLVPRFC